MKNEGSKFYVTRDPDGIFLWRAAVRPVRRGEGSFFSPLYTVKERLPVALYGELIRIGEIRVIDAFDLLLARRQN